MCAMELVKENIEMAEMTLRSLEVQNFRGFEHLQIEHLGKVNLIVGKNNVGKTSLLEALRWYAYKFSPDILRQILSKRDEGLVDSSEKVSGTGRLVSDVDVGKVLASLRYIFHGRTEIYTDSLPVIIGPKDEFEKRGVFEIRWSSSVEEKVRNIAQNQLPIFEDIDAATEKLIPRYIVRWGQRTTTDYPLHFAWASPRLLRANSNSSCIYIESDGLSLSQVDTLWGAISLTPLEKEVLEALRIVAPGIEALNIVSQRPRSIIVKVAGLDEPLPLRSLGNGMVRALGIALALVNAREGILLIDELENGLHYSVQTDIWRLIFRLAHQLNIQVFATTHSWDCIEGFQKAAQEMKNEEGILISLENRKAGVGAVIFNEEELRIVTREHIEVR
jgi:AAA domain, putative AbiEii toxin, Type IV TA system